MKRRSFLQILGFGSLGALASPVLSSTQVVMPARDATPTGRIPNTEPALQYFPLPKNVVRDYASGRRSSEAYMVFPAGRFHITGMTTYSFSVHEGLSLPQAVIIAADSIWTPSKGWCKNRTEDRAAPDLSTYVEVDVVDFLDEFCYPPEPDHEKSRIRHVDLKKLRRSV